MKILSIETSCDETAVSIVEANGGLVEPHFVVLGNSLFSQIDIHKEYGGVFPMLAKREHAKNLIPLLIETLKQADEFISYDTSYENESLTKIEKVEKTLEREEGLFEDLKNNLVNIKIANIDLIAVTSGPGLEPALWVGISFAKALSILWDVPVLPVNHMEGHIFSILINGKNEISNDKFQITNENTKANQIQFPALALLISGGHTEIVEIETWGKYKILGTTRDDAVGEAFDKVARLLGLPYPGGPEISKLAEIAREEKLEKKCKLPRPMIHSNDFDFSFSGLKTAVLYYIRDLKREISEDDKKDIAREFEDAVVEVLMEKTKKALMENDIKTLIVAGGVISNKKIREAVSNLKNEFSDLIIKLPEGKMSTDNSIMIALAGYLEISLHPEKIKGEIEIKAEGNLKLA